MTARILFLTTSSNWPLTDGKRQRTWFLLEALSKKFTVDVLLIGYQKDKEEFNTATSSVNKLYFVNNPQIDFSTISLPSYILSKKRRTAKKIYLKDLNDFFYNLYIENHYTFLFSRYLQPLLYLNLPKKIKVICDLDDVYFETQQSRIKNEVTILQKLKLKILYHLGVRKVKKIINRIDIPIIVKESDRSFYGLQTAACLPNLPFSYFIESRNLSLDNSICVSSSELKFGFIGKLSYKPNYLGLLHFIHFVWNPLIINNFNSRLVIAGSGEIPEKLRKVIETSKNIDLLGFVAVPELFWKEISVLVVPISEGGGSNIKIAEAFIQGITVIAHPFAARGYNDFIESGHLILPKDDRNWIEIMNSTFISTPEQKQILHNKAKELYDFDFWNETLLTIIS